MSDISGSGAVISGVDEMIDKLTRVASDIQQKAAAALYREAELIMTRSKRDFVPFNDGTLRDSGTVGLPVIADGEISVEMGFGGEASAYALAVHEHPSKSSPPSWEGKAIEDIHSVRTGQAWGLDGRGPKYLERPLNDAADGLTERIAEAMKS